MKHIGQSILTACLLLGAASAQAQNAAPPPIIASPPPVAIAPPAIGMLSQPCSATNANSRQLDWPWLCRYRAENALVGQGSRPKVVFMGDSITEGWKVRDPAFFGADVIDRGISGQTTPQMVLRFWQDVVALRPRVVHIMAGTNDVAGNTGPNSPEDYRNNIRAMVDLARANGIRVVIGSILPADRFLWSPTLRPAAQIVELNRWLKSFAAAKGLVYADYYAAMANPDGGLPRELSPDGVHPNLAGYEIMRPLAERAIAQALAQR